MFFKYLDGNFYLSNHFYSENNPLLIEDSVISKEQQKTLDNLTSYDHTDVINYHYPNSKKINQQKQLKQQQQQQQRKSPDLLQPPMKIDRDNGSLIDDNVRLDRQNEINSPQFDSLGGFEMAVSPTKEIETISNISKELSPIPRILSPNLNLPSATRKYKYPINSETRSTTSSFREMTSTQIDTQLAFTQIDTQSSSSTSSSKKSPIHTREVTEQKSNTSVKSNSKILDSNQNLINKRIKKYFPNHKAWFEGIVQSYNP